MFIAVFVIHNVRVLLQIYGIIEPGKFAIMQVAVCLDFTLFLIPIIYVLNVHRTTFNDEANITESSYGNRTGSQATPSYSHSPSAHTSSINTKEDLLFNKQGRTGTPSHAEELFFSAYRQNTEPAEPENRELENAEVQPFSHSVPEVVDLFEDELNQTMQGYQLRVAIRSSAHLDN